MANLSHGEIAGLVIGCVAAYLVVQAVVFLRCRRSKRRHGGGVWEDSSQHHGWYNNTANANAESPFFVPFARRHRDSWDGFGLVSGHSLAFGHSLTIKEDAPARIWEVKPAPRGGQVGNHHTSPIMHVAANGYLGRCGAVVNLRAQYKRVTEQERW